MSCSRTQCSDAGKARTRGPSVLSQQSTSVIHLLESIISHARIQEFLSGGSRPITGGPMVLLHRKLNFHKDPVSPTFSKGQCFFSVLGEWWQGLSKGEN